MCALELFVWKEENQKNTIQCTECTHGGVSFVFCIQLHSRQSFNSIRSLKPFPLCTNRGSRTYAFMCVLNRTQHTIRSDRVRFIRSSLSRALAASRFLVFALVLWTVNMCAIAQKMGVSQIDVFRTQWVDKGVSFCACVSVFYRNLQYSTSPLRSSLLLSANYTHFTHYRCFVWCVFFLFCFERIRSNASHNVCMVSSASPIIIIASKGKLHIRKSIFFILYANRSNVFGLIGVEKLATFRSFWLYAFFVSLTNENYTLAIFCGNWIWWLYEAAGFYVLLSYKN